MSTFMSYVGIFAYLIPICLILLGILILILITHDVTVSNRTLKFIVSFLVIISGVGLILIMTTIRNEDRQMIQTDISNIKKQYPLTSYYINTSQQWKGYTQSIISTKPKQISPLIGKYHIVKEPTQVIYYGPDYDITVKNDNIDINTTSINIATLSNVDQLLPNTDIDINFEVDKIQDIQIDNTTINIKTDTQLISLTVKPNIYEIQSIELNEY